LSSSKNAQTDFISVLHIFPKVFFQFKKGWKKGIYKRRTGDSNS